MEKNIRQINISLHSFDNKYNSEPTYIAEDIYGAVKKILKK